MLILIPAAGLSSRMRGRDKLLEQVDGQPLLARQVGIALQTAARVLVTLPEDRPERAAVLGDIRDDRFRIVTIADADEGMAASIRAGASHAGASGEDALMVFLADLPEIAPDDLMQLMRAFDGNHVVRATSADGRPGHPVIFPARLFPALNALTGDQGARSVLSGEDVTDTPLPGTRATTDLDTPEAWADWRARNPP